jgi:hypothetical protein
MAERCLRGINKLSILRPIYGDLAERGVPQKSQQIRTHKRPTMLKHLLVIAKHMIIKTLVL